MSTTRDNTSYVPKSPDLSSLYAGSEAHPSSRPNHYAFPSPRTSTSTSRGTYYPLQPPGPTQVQTQVQAQLDTPAFNPAQHLAQHLAPHPAQPHYQYQTHHNNNTLRTSNGSAATTTIANHNAYRQPLQQHPPFATYHDDNQQHALSPYPHQPGAQFYPLQHQAHYPPSQQLVYPSQTAPPYYPSHTDSPTSAGHLTTSQTPPQLQHPHHQAHQQQQPQQHHPSPAFDQSVTSDNQSAMPRGKAAAQAVKEPEIMESPVRTKFPTARIKRIMQADEEVGKVAQQTPIAVGKALELFMVQLVHRSAEVAKEKNSKRITAPMLKQAIDSTNEWDFLRDIVAKVAEEKEGARSGGRVKAESDSDDDADTGEVKKKGRGGRKKKAST